MKRYIPGMIEKIEVYYKRIRKPKFFQYKYFIFILIIIISTLMHFKHFSKDLMSIHVWRQTQTQSTINNFYEEDMNILNPRRNNRGDTDGIFRMEFPLMQWLIANLYKVFGKHVIITRIFMLVLGFVTLFGVYKLTFSLFTNIKIALLCAWAFNFSPGFFYYTINPLPDLFAMCFGIWGLAVFFMWLRKSKLYLLIISLTLLSISALTKLPFILYFIVPFIYFLIVFFKNGVNRRIIINTIISMIFLVLPLIWYITVIPTWEGNPIVLGILNGNETLSTTIDNLQSNLFSTLPELILNYGSVLPFLAGIYFLFKNQAHKNSNFVLLLILSILLIFYYFFEINAIAKIHDYYLFPFFPLLFLIVGYGAYNLLFSKQKIIKYITVMCLIILPITCHLRAGGRWNPDSPGFNKDLLTYKSELREATPKNKLVVAGNDNSGNIFLYYIDKKGWVFYNDNLTTTKLNGMINSGARYLYTDSESIINNKDISSLFDTLIDKKGSIYIYKLIDKQVRN